jgi:hypothetical protein
MISAPRLGRSALRESLAAASLAALLLAAPSSARALTLLDAELALSPAAAERPSLTLAVANEGKAEAKDEPSLDFDLLGAPPEVPQVDDSRMHRRRSLLKAHQAVGLGLFALQLATTVVGQLNYSDKYANGPVTGRYELTHSVLAYTNFGVHALNGTLAFLAPKPRAKASRGFDRVTLHKIGMFTATAGMLAQVGLGVYTDRREGYLNQERYAKAHLAVGYATLAAVTVAVGALVL